MLLTPKQRQTLGRWRAAAHRRHRDLGLITGLADQWPEQQTIAIYRTIDGPETTRHSLTQATQDDYATLMARFTGLAGDDQASAYWLRRATPDISSPRPTTRTHRGPRHILADTTNTRRQQMWLLQRACAAKTQPYPDYPLRIAAHTHILGHRDTLAEFTADELLQLLKIINGKAPDLTPAQ